MSWRDLKYKSSDLSSDNFLQLLDNGSMKFVEFVLWHHLSDELPKDDFFAGAFVGLFVLDGTDQILPLRGEF